MSDTNQTGNYASYATSLAGMSANWQPIITAPRDGTLIETRCEYGVAPWYGVFRWKDGRWQSEDGVTGVGETRLSWRPLTQHSWPYVDPTGGAQNTNEYWLRAVDAKHGTSFSKQPAPRPWWRFW